MPMKIVSRPRRTTAELIALINQRQADWWPSRFDLSIDRSAEHDWIAIVNSDAVNPGKHHADLVNSVGQVVSELRLRNAWAGY